jgi:hypothetical protein
VVADVAGSVDFEQLVIVRRTVAAPVRVSKRIVLSSLIVAALAVTATSAQQI